MSKYKSIPDAFIKTADLYKDKEILRYRVNDNDSKKESIKYKDLYDKVNCCAKAFEKYGMTDKHICIFSENRLQWFIVDMALLSIGSVDVPRGNDSTEKELEYIYNHSDSCAIIVENTYMYNKVKSFASKAKFILVLDSSIDDKDNNIISFDRFMDEGKESLNGDNDFIRKTVAKIDKENIVTIIYTSGTTSIPKGVVLKHKNILHNIDVVPDIIDLKVGETLVSMLPIWHIYERTISYIAITFGCPTTISNKKNLKIDLVEEKPDIFVSVPAIWENIYNAVLKSINKKSFIARTIANFLLKRSTRYVRRRRYEDGFISLTGDEKKEDHKREYPNKILDALWHKLAKSIIYKNILALTGGNIRLTTSAGSTLPSYLEDFLEACGMTFTSGWGITETSPVISLSSYKKNYMGTSGPIVPRVEVEVRDSEGNVLEDGCLGVCWIKGENVFSEYYKNEELTKEVLVDGWFNSGDLGVFSHKKEIIIKGREKETVVLLTGENVEPQPIENKILESPYIEQIIIVGQDKPLLGALIVLNNENINNYCKKHNIELYIKKLSNIKGLERFIKKEISKMITSQNGFKKFETVSRIAILSEGFTIENNLLTQSLKMKRNEITKRYKDIIESIYSFR